MKYYEMEDDIGIAGRWWLNSPIDAHGNAISPESFRRAQAIEVAVPLAIPARHSGTALDFTFGAFEMPVVNLRTVELLEKFAKNAFQAFQTRVSCQPEEYAAINFLEVRKCVDESRAEFLKWTEHDHRADKAGEYRQMSKMAIDPSLAGNADVFRLWGWKIAVIVSERIQRAFIEHRITGVRFRSVC